MTDMDHTHSSWDAASIFGGNIVDNPLEADANPVDDQADAVDTIPDEAGVTPGEDDPGASEVDIPDLED